MSAIELATSLFLELDDERCLVAELRNKLILLQAENEILKGRLEIDIYNSK